MFDCDANVNLFEFIHFECVNESNLLLNLSHFEIYVNESNLFSSFTTTI